MKKEQFFSVQHRLNRQTFMLYGLFLLSTMTLIGILHVILARINFNHALNGKFSFNDHFEWLSPYSIAITSGVVIFIIGAYFYKFASVPTGDTIARALGAEEITHRSDNPYYKLINQYVIEMAIASNIPPPSVYVQLENRSINAFAAGYIGKNSVVAISRGAIEQLTRDEMKALIAHEISHIADGDTKMNRHILAVIFGFMALSILAIRIVGTALDQVRVSGRRSKEGFALVFLLILIGAVIWIFSLILQFFGKLIQSFISRRREFFADSNAVSSTRQAAGIYTLLLKLKSMNNVKETSIQDALFGKAESPEYQHFYFSNTVRFNFFKTHPPIDKRLESIMVMMTALDQEKMSERTALISDEIGVSFEETLKKATQKNNRNINKSNSELEGAPYALPIAGAVLADSIGNDVVLPRSAEVTERLSPELKRLLSSKEYCIYPIYALMLSKHPNQRHSQMDSLINVKLNELSKAEIAVMESKLPYPSVLLRIVLQAMKTMTSDSISEIYQNINALYTLGDKTFRSFSFEYLIRQMLPKSSQLPKIPCVWDDKSKEIIWLCAVMMDKVTQLEPIRRNSTLRNIIRENFPHQKVESIEIIRDPNWMDKTAEILEQLSTLSTNNKRELLLILRNICVTDKTVTELEYDFLQFSGFILKFPYTTDLKLK